MMNGPKIIKIMSKSLYHPAGFLLSASISCGVAVAPRWHRGWARTAVRHRGGGLMSGQGVGGLGDEHAETIEHRHARWPWATV